MPITFTECLKVLRKRLSLNQYRVEKCRVLFELAGKSNGSIVELGSYHGMSTIALAMATSHSVWSVDNWNNEGWAGEVYSNRDYEKFLSNTDDLENLFSIYAGIYHAGVNWDFGNVDLIFWDTGVEDCLVDHFSVWADHLNSGGLFLVHDTSDYRLGWNELKASVDWPVEEHGSLHGLRKP